MLRVSEERVHCLVCVHVRQMSVVLGYNDVFTVVVKNSTKAFVFLSLRTWPPRSPDLTPCDFFLWGYIKDTVYVPPLPQNLDELKNRIRTAITSVTPHILSRVWQEVEYRCDIVRVVGGGHIEHL